MISDNAKTLAKELIKKSEGLELVGYADPARGIPTIGWGHTGPDIQDGQIIDEEQAESYLDEDIEMAVEVINDYVTVDLTDGQAAALIDFIFNEGEGEFAKSTLLIDLNFGRYEMIPEELMKWVYAHVNGVLTKMNGLIIRRGAEVDLWNL